MREERIYAVSEWVISWVCNSCGEVIDPVILINRQWSLDCIRGLKKGKLKGVAHARFKNVDGGSSEGGTG
jgi:hypothetical protein